MLCDWLRKADSSNNLFMMICKLQSKQIQQFILFWLLLDQTNWVFPVFELSKYPDDQVINPVGLLSLHILLVHQLFIPDNIVIIDLNHHLFLIPKRNCF